MRRIWAMVLVSGLVVVSGGCAPAEGPQGETGDEPAAVGAAEPGEVDPGSFEAGDTRGWDTAQGDDSRTDFETGDASSWSDTRGEVQESKPDDDG